MSIYRPNIDGVSLGNSIINKNKIDELEQRIDVLEKNNEKDKQDFIRLSNNATYLIDGYLVQYSYGKYNFKLNFRNKEPALLNEEITITLIDDSKMLYINNGEIESYIELENKDIHLYADKNIIRFIIKSDGKYINKEYQYKIDKDIYLEIVKYCDKAYERLGGK